MVIIIIHIGYITYLVTNDAWHAYNVIVVYVIPHGDDGISYFRGTGHTVQLAYFRLTLHKYTHFPSTDNVSDWVCRWLDRIYSLQL